MSDSIDYRVNDPVEYKELRIIDVLRDIKGGGIVLPPIQRKAVWKEKQITDFFDSILRGYPLNNFLFWRIKKQFVNDKHYTLYKFLTIYDQRDNYNESLGKPLLFSSEDPEADIIAVLDGQQRLTALNVALQGCLRLKKPYKDEYPDKQLYIVFHLIDEQDDSDDEDETISSFDGVNPKFQFLSTEEEAHLPNELHRINVKDIIKYTEKEQAKLIRELQEKKYYDAETDICGLLWQKIRLEKLINVCYIKREAIEDVVRIFVRINSGGTQLVKTDLLFSTVVSYWNDAREKIELLSKNIKEEHYEFNTDFYMQACLYVLNISLRLTPEVFENQVNVETIKQKWEQIRSAITDVISFLRETGYNQDTLSSQNALLPLIYCRYRGGLNYFSECKDEFKKYLAIAQLKSLLGRSSNTTLGQIRTALQNGLFADGKYEKFSLNWLITKLPSPMATLMTCTH